MRLRQMEPVQISTNYEKILLKFAVLSFARNEHNSFKTIFNGDIFIKNLQGGTFAFEHL